MDKLWIEALYQVKDLTSNPEVFLEPKKCETHFSKSKSITKVLYDATKLIENECNTGKGNNTDSDFMKTLPELIVDDFDAEQVWAGVDLQNKAKYQKFVNKIEHLAQLAQNNKALHQLNSNINELNSKTVKKHAFNLITGTLVEKDTIDNDTLYEEEDDLHELELDRSYNDANRQQKQDHEESDSSASEDDMEQKDKHEENGDDDNPDDENPEDIDSILNDPDFQHMSDSDLDDLPLASAESEDEEMFNDDSHKIDADSERKREAQEAKEKKRNELNAKTDNYMQNALQSMRSQTGLKEKKDKVSINSGRSEVEDQFFKLDEMEAFLDNQDALESRKIAREEKGLPEEQIDEDIDLFGEDWEAEDDEGRGLTWKDYHNDEEKEKSNVNDKIPQSEEDSASEDDSMEIGDDEIKSGTKHLLSDDETDEDLGEVKSTHELRQLRLKKKIQKMEQEALSQVGGVGKDDQKIWQMKGEITAADRPENSLLQEHLDYDTVSKQAPIITEQVSKRLEDIIVQRIKDQAYDNVERKVKPVENPYEYKKKLILDQEKSKLSLAEVYEQEYLKQKSSLEEAAKKPGMLDDDGNEQTPKEVESIRRSMNILFSKLDSLTHFHFTPKAQGHADIKVIKNTATLSMEEVAPVAMSDATLLAPQEIIDRKRGEEIGSSERIDTDKKRDRRHKKELQKKRKKEAEKREKEVTKLNPGLGNKYSKAKALKVLENAEKQANGKLKRIKEDSMKGKSVKSSTAFFNQLQNDALSTVNEAKVKKKSDKSSIKLSTSNLKL